MSAFAERLKDLRNRKGQTQDEVGKAVGKSREAVSKYEIGEREPDLNAVASLARYFNVSTDYMLGITDDSGLLNGRRRKPFNPALYAYEKYLEDEEFVPYLALAVKARDSRLALGELESLIQDLIKRGKKQKHP